MRNLKKSMLSSRPAKLEMGLVFLASFMSCQDTSQVKILKEAPTTQVVDSSVASVSARPVHWSYEGETKPENWGELSPVYALCRVGKHQSPINIRSSTLDHGIQWAFRYKNSSLRIAHNEHMDDILDNGHTIQVTVDEGSTFLLNGSTYHLKQFHFHTPSEHQVDGQHFPMEVHFVHQNDSGQFAVVAALVTEGPSNDNIEQIIQHLPEIKGEIKHLKEIQLALQFHLPPTSEAFHYIGSLTTPPCKEEVEWLVLKNPVKASRSQIQAISSKIGKNNRPVQSLNDRKLSLELLKGEIN